MSGKHTTTGPVERAAETLASWGLRVQDADRRALDAVHTRGCLPEVMELVHRVQQTVSPDRVAPVIPEEIRRRRVLEEARRAVPSHRADKPPSVLAFERRADAFPPARRLWEFTDSQQAFRCLLCGFATGRYSHADAVMAAAEEHVQRCGGAAA